MNNITAIVGSWVLVASVAAMGAVGVALLAVAALGRLP